jgi:hypothetical protein
LVQVSAEQLLSGDEPQEEDAASPLRSEKVMFGVDYPHFESIVPHTLDRVAELVLDYAVPEADTRKILYENAAAVYGFDLATLQTHMERVGFQFGRLESRNIGSRIWDKNDRPTATSHPQRRVMRRATLMGELAVA